jgi:2-oxoacid:acceptor oxidoreductase gamma subunit (pyruvate/2-ketoisovalerate family)
MLEIRFHGRGGQGTVVASRLLAYAAFLENKQIQTFPTFTVERRGSPVCGYVRISDRAIYDRYPIYNPHHVIVLDPSLLKFIDVTDGLRPGGFVLVNYPELHEVFKDNKNFKFAYVDATSIAVRHGIGTKATPIVNTAILGSLVKVLNIVSMDSIIKAIRDNVPVKTEQNVAAAKEAYEKVILV